MFEGFQQDARAVVIRAREEATSTGQLTIGTEHLLLGLLTEPGVAADALRAAGADADSLRARLPTGAAGADGASDGGWVGGRRGPGKLDADALASLGIDLDAVRRATDATFGPGALDRAGAAGQARRARGRARMTPEAKKALEKALRAAAKQHSNIGAAHLLLGVLDEPTGPAATALTATGVDVAELHADILRRLQSAA